MNASIVLDDDFLEALVERVADKVAERIGDARPAPVWFDVVGAAAYLASGEHAIRSAERVGALKGSRDARGRLRFHRDDLDRYARGR